jgi:hypothetical protein
MLADPSYAEAIQAILTLVELRSDILDFEFLCDFNRNLLYFLEHHVRSTPFGTAKGNPVQSLREASTLALRIQQPLLFGNFRRLDPERWPASLTTHNEAALDIVQITLCMAQRHTTLQPIPRQNRQWAFGQNDEELEQHAALKRKLVARTVQEVYSIILVWVKVVLREGDQRWPRTRNGVLEAMSAASAIIVEVAGWTEEDTSYPLSRAVAQYARDIDKSGLQTKHPHLNGGFEKVMKDIFLKSGWYVDL